ncbi:uncharacterized protein DNG_08946 [Cephalotrichum gorgonifer]|uniref:Xylanolytic transcriptional activator regulatory domain-containing protein n=1 Tax=Cephalotrichum gorgonifer TaxID=2041049 RepID=A0AAE8SZP8_9PEZI|nr:uncharacterized protein DNG_08946 [Cephalotrichum gorgonifer]
MGSEAEVTATTTQHTSPPRPRDHLAFDQIPTEDASQTPAALSPLDLTFQCGPEDLVDGALTIPPWLETQDVVDTFLRTFNWVLPLFGTQEVIDKFTTWYAQPLSHSRVTWAELSVILALAHGITGHDDPASASAAAEHLNNAQSVVSELLAAELTLSTVRVLVGIAIIFQATANLRPATFIIATALRLAHHLGLHTRRTHGPDPAVNTQRDRVFWMAYLVDKDISLRARQPSVQLDADVDLDLPSDGGDELDTALGGYPDVPGYVFTSDRQSRFNIFGARLRLARIQGTVYDILWSARARNLGPDQRAENLLVAKKMLIEWQSSVPPVFRPGTFRRHVPPEAYRYLVILNHSFLFCLALAYDLDGSRQAQAKEVIANTEVGVPPAYCALLAGNYRDGMADFMALHVRDASFVW